MPDSRTVKITALFDRILTIGLILAGVMLFFMMFSVCFNVIARYAFNSPSIWVDEITSILLLFLPFFVGAWILKNERHVRMDLILSHMQHRTRFKFEIVSLIIISAVCVVFLVYGLKVALELFEIGYKTETNLQLSKWPIISVIPIGFFLIFLQAIRNILKKIQELRSQKPKSNDLD